MAAFKTLKVFIQPTSHTKTFQFLDRTTIADVIDEIKAKSNFQIDTTNFGLFVPPSSTTAKQAYWLRKGSLIKNLQVDSNIVLQFKSKFRPLKVCLTDGTSRTIMIDDSATVREISDAIGEKFEIRSLEEFCLRKVTPPHLFKSPLWLDEGRTLHSQPKLEVAMDEPLEFAKRYYSTAELEHDDFFTLHLLFDDANKSIISGRYPCNREDIKYLTSLQIQLHYKDYDPQCPATNFDRTLFLPKQYRKDDKLVNEIIYLHKTWYGIHDHGAKFRYVSRVRSLKSYGVTFFLCTQKVDGHKKPLKLSIGVTRDRIIKIDTKTQTQLKSWPLTQLCRWSGEDGVFTFDFGDFDDNYMTVFTDEAEALHQAIAGYIDIILQQRIDTVRVIEEDHGEIAEEEQITGNFGLAHHGVTSSFTPSYNQGKSNQNLFSPGSQNSGQFYDPNSSNNADISILNGPNQVLTSSEMSPSQRANIVDVSSCIKMCRLLSEELSSKKLLSNSSSLPEQEWKKKFDLHQQNLKSNTNDFLLKALKNPNDLKKSEIDKKAKEIAFDLKGMGFAASALTDLYDDNSHLVDSCKSMSDTIGDILDGLMKNFDDSQNGGTMTELLESCHKVFQSNLLLCQKSQLCNYGDEGSKLLMLECIHEISLNFDGMIKEVQISLPKLPQSSQKQILTEIGKIQSIQTLVTKNLSNLCSQVLDPEIANQLIKTSEILADSKLKMIEKLNHFGFNLNQNATLVGFSNGVDYALKNLKNSLLTVENRAIEGNLIYYLSEDLCNSLQSCQVNFQNPDLLLEGMTNVTKAQNELSVLTKTVVSGFPLGVTAPLLDYNKGIAVAIQQLLLVSRDLHSTGDLINVEKACAIVGKVQSQVYEMRNEVASVAALINLRFTSKVATASLMKLSSASNSAARNCINLTVRADLLASAKSVKDSLTALFATLQDAVSDPSNLIKQSALLELTNQNIPYYSQLVSIVKTATTRSITDPNIKQKLNHAAQETAGNLRHLMRAIHDSPDLLGQDGIERALEEFDASNHDLETAEFFAEQGLLKPLPGQTREDSQALLKKGIDLTNSEISRIFDVSIFDFADGIREIASGFGQIVVAARTIASTMSDRNSQKQIFRVARELLDDTLEVIKLERAVKVDNFDLKKNSDLEKGKRKFYLTLGSLNKFASCVDVTDVNLAIQSIESAKGELIKRCPTKISFRDAADGVEGSVKALNSVVGQLISVTKSGNPANLGSISKLTSTTLIQLLNSTSIATSSSPDSKIGDQILTAARAIADSIQDLLNSAKNVATQKSALTLSDFDKKSQVFFLSTEEILGSLVSTRVSPQVDDAMKKIKKTLRSLEIGQVNVSPSTRESLLNEFLSCAKDMARVTSELISSAHVSTNKHGQVSLEAAGLVKNLLMTAQAATISNGQDNAASLPVVRISEGCEEIIQSPRDLQKITKILNSKICPCAGKIMEKAKEMTKNLAKSDERSSLVTAVQNVIASTQALKESRGEPTEVASIALKLKENVWGLEDLIFGISRETSQDRRVDPRVADLLVESAKSVAEGILEMIHCSSLVINNSDNEQFCAQLETATSNVSSALQNLNKTSAELNPAVKECERAIIELQKVSSSLDVLLKASLMGNLTKNDDQTKSYPELQNETCILCDSLLCDLSVVVSASNGPSIALKKSTIEICDSVQRCTEKIKETVFACADSSVQIKLLTASKTVSDLISKILNENIFGADKDSPQRIQKLQENVRGVVGTIISELQSSNQIIQELDLITQKIRSNIEELGKKPENAYISSYSESRQILENETKELVSALTVLNLTDKTNPGQLCLGARKISEKIPGFIAGIRGCILATNENKLKVDLVNSTKKVGGSVLQLIQATKGIIQGNCESTGKFNEIFAISQKALVELLISSKSGIFNTEDPIRTLNNWINQLNTALVFSQAGQLEEQKATLGLSLDDLVQKNSTVGLNLKRKIHEIFINSGKSGISDERLGELTVSFSQGVEAVVKISWALAAKMQDSNGQQDVLGSVKLVALIAQQFIFASNEVHKFPHDPQVKQELQKTQEAILNQISNLSSVIEHIATENLRCQTELENAIQGIKALKNATSGYPQSTLEDVIYGCQEVISASSVLVFAQNQVDIIEAGKENLSAVDVLINAALTVAKNAPEKNLGLNLIANAHKTADEVCRLLEIAKLSRQDPTTQMKLENQGEKVTAGINGIVATLRRFPGATMKGISLNDKDLDQHAQQELIKCQQIIEDSLKSIQSPKPSKISPSDQYDQVNQTVFDAAKIVCQTSASLLSVTLQKQIEKTKKSKLTEGDKYQPDPLFISGLISSAQNVAVCCQEISFVTNHSICVKPDEETLIATAVAVGQATNAYIYGLSGKFKEQNAIQVSAKAVVVATHGLVKAAKGYSAVQEGVLNQKALDAYHGVGHNVSETDQWVKIIRLERELEQERKKAEAIKQVKLKANNRKTLLIQSGR